MAIQVYNEIGKLKKVMLHRPGRELEHLLPGDLARLLFDDIPYLEAAQREHDHFADVLRAEGVEVVYLEDLMAEVLDREPEIREPFLRQFIDEGGMREDHIRENILSFLQQITDTKKLVLALMSGVRENILDAEVRSPLIEMIGRQRQFLLDPMPNLYFTRDPFASIGRGVSLNHMYSPVRRRETIFGEYILRHHPDFAGAPLYYDRKFPFDIEGGDILNLSPRVLAVGISQRTSPEGIERLANALFSDETVQTETILALDIPAVRAFMHLDTVFTQVDTGTFTIHPDILRTVRIFEIRRDDLGPGLKVRERSQPLADLLAEYLELDHVCLIRCGGTDRIASEREQWNDGSNTLCVEPGKVIAYDRNYVTNRILREHGIQVIEIPSSELSRGRGGPRCMSMPLIREDI